MATTKAKERPAAATTRKPAATRKRTRTTTTVPKQAAASSANPPRTSEAPSAYGPAFWSRAGILSSLALGVLILVQVNADRPAEYAAGESRSTASSGSATQAGIRPAYPAPGYGWPPTPAFHRPATPTPAYGYRPWYGPGFPGGVPYAYPYRKYDRKG